ncbi:MAG TPA: polyprenyl synthetase family protein [Polyangiaceae bacterium]
MTAARTLPAGLSLPRARTLFDEHFDRTRLGTLVGIEDERVIALVREATWKSLAGVLGRPGKQVRARMLEHAHAIVREHRGASVTPDLHPDLPHLFELLHAGSLVVDDVQDEAKDRRGRPALHHLVGQARAINAGNMLYFLPLWLIDDLGLEPAVALSIHRAFARQVLKCHHGQALDLAAPVTALPQRDVPAIVEACSALKTGALFELVTSVGAIAAKASPNVEQALARFAREAGVALQMLDDLTSVTRPARRAKGLEDLRAARPTWVWAVVARSLPAPEYAELLARFRKLAVAGDPSAMLDDLGARVIAAETGAHVRWRTAVASLRETLGRIDAIDELERELEILEHGYVG